jgi:outer membrane lipoprotein carrier protein
MIARLAVTLVLGSPLLLAGGAETTPGELALALQRKYDAVRDFSADFVHTYRGGVLRRQLVEQGRLTIRKPGKMRWEYTSPEEKLFVSDGKTLYSYLPADNQVIVSEMPAEDRAATPALFLAGKGSLARDFTSSFAELPEGLPEDALGLKLVPVRGQPDYEWLILAVDPETLALRGLVFVDAQGGTSTFAFTNLKENVGPPDKTFVFTPPRGADVVTDSSRR